MTQISAALPGRHSRRGFLGLTAAALAGSAGALSGCSNFSNGGSSSGSGDASGGAGDGTFTFTFWGTGAEKTAVSKVIQDYCAAKGLTAKPQSIPDAYETKLNTLLAANNPPDAGYLTESMAMRLGEQNKIINIAGQPGFEDFLPAVIHHWAPDKAVSQTAVEVMCFWYDEDATTQAGVTPPATSATAWDYDALVQAADKLTVDDNGRRPSESGFDPENVKRYGVAAPSTLPALVSLLKSNGVDLFDEGGTKTNLDSPEAIKVLQDISDLIFTHRVSPTPAQATTFGASTALLLASKRVAMAMDGQWALLDLAQSKIKYNVAVLPKYQTPITTILGGATGIFADSPYEKDAMELTVQLGDPTKVPLYASGLWMPMDKKYYTDEAAIKTWVNDKVHPSNYRTAVMEPTLAGPTPFPSYKIKNFTIIQTTLANGLTPMFTRQTDVAAAATKLAASVNKLMQGSYPDIIA